MSHNLSAARKLSSEDALFLKQFEDCTLPADNFDHRGHIKLTFLLLLHCAPDTAMQRILTGIEHYAMSLGAANKFHKTLSWFMVKEIAWRITKQGSVEWSDFLVTNHDLLQNSLALLQQHYSETTLNTDLARLNIVEPDRKAPEWYV